MPLFPRHDDDDRDDDDDDDDVDDDDDDDVLRRFATGPRGAALCRPSGRVTRATAGARDSAPQARPASPRLTSCHSSPRAPPDAADRLLHLRPCGLSLLSPQSPCVARLPCAQRPTHA